MFNNFKKKNPHATIFLIGLFALTLLPSTSLAATGPTTEKLSAPYVLGAGLPTVPAITNFGGSELISVEEAKQRITDDENQITNLISIKKELASKRSNNSLFQTAANIAAGVAGGGAGIGSAVGGLFFNSEKDKAIISLEKDAEAKIEFLRNDQARCKRIICNILLAEAQATGDNQKMQDAQTKCDEAQQKAVESRVAANKAIAEFKAVNSIACWPAGSVTPDVGNCVLEITSWVGNTLTYIFALFLWIASGIFDSSISLSIVMVGKWFRQVSAIGDAWRVIRDFSNLFFVFTLLYIAIGTIFDLGGISKPQKMIMNVIIIALLVNFSGFFVRVVVDASNITAYEFYSSMGGGDPDASISSSLIKKMNLGARFIEASSLSAAQTAGDTVINNLPQVDRLNFLSIIAGTIGNILIILAISFVFLVAAILFIIRTVALLILYIISPLAITSMILPGGKFNKFEEWSKALIKYSFFAPAFLVPLYVVWIILGPTGISHIAATPAAGGWGLVGDQSSVVIVMVDILILGLIISCLFIAQKIGTAGSQLLPGLTKGAARLASRPISRYGGRLAGSVGAGIAASSIGKKAAESWNNGSLRLVRRSWDTGVLREARDTETAKKVGQAMRNPLTTALGMKPFSEGVDARSKKYLEDVKKLESDEDKARFIDGLAGVTGREEFDNIFDKMSPEERRKVELAARKTANDTSKTPTVRASAKKVADRMTEDRKKLTGKKAQETAIELVKKSKGTDKFLAVEHLSEGDFNEVYKGLGKEDQLALEKEVRNSGIIALKRKLDVARSKLKTGEQIAVNQGISSEEAFSRVEAAKGNPGSVTAQDVRSLSREKIVEVDLDTLADPNVAVHLTSEQLKALRNADLNEDKVSKIRETIEREIEEAKKPREIEGKLKPETALERVQREAAGLPPPREKTIVPGKLPPHLEKLDAYFKLGGAGF